MKLKFKVSEKTKTAFLKAKLKISKHSPEILLVTGIVGVVGSAVMACVATTKAHEIVEDAKADLEEVKKCTEESVLLPKYTKEDRAKDLTIIYVKTGVKFVKLYLPSVLLGAVSILSIVSSNNILKRRNKEIAAAYTALSASYAAYRMRVKEALGEDADDELYYGVKTKEIETTDPETGEVKKDRIPVVEDCPLSPHARYFERPNPNYEDSLQGNILWLEAKENLANMMLKARASENVPLFLNEVYQLLGFPMTKAGQKVGWRYDPENPDIDCAVKFRIQVVKKPDGSGSYYDAILLDFNVDGDVWSDWVN